MKITALLLIGAALVGCETVTTTTTALDGTVTVVKSQTINDAAVGAATVVAGGLVDRGSNK